jgi:DNA-binding beta-propeller fold protein YncE
VTNPVSDFSGTDRFGRVSRIDLRTRKVTARIRVPAPPIALAANDAAVWVGLDRGETLWRIDPHDEVAAAAVQVGPVIDLALGEGAVWALSPDGTVSRIDPSTNAVTRSVRLGRGSAIAAGHGAVWVAGR